MPTPRSRTASAKRTPRARASAPRAAATAPRTGAHTRLGARTEFRIYPSIGIARVGDSKDGFIIGPESPGIAPDGPHRGADKGIKPQAARFRIYKVEIDANENETVTEEVVAGGNIEIAWTVDLANRKAAGFKIQDTLGRKKNPRPRNKGLDRKKLVITASGSVSGAKKTGPALSGTIEFAKPGSTGKKVTDIALATLGTDDKGRLLVIGGPGKSGSPGNTSIGSFCDNDGWYDSVSDGPVSATLRVGGRTEQVVPAWVVIAVPRFAPAVYGIVTWFDRALDMARTTPEGRFTSPRTTSFTHDIFPILQRADRLSAVNGTAHGNGAIAALSDATRIAGFKDRGARADILSRLTQPGTDAKTFEQRPPGTMPLLFSGANPEPELPVFTFMALTRYQLAHMQNWARGNFADDWPGSPPAPVPFDKIPVARQAWALCEAALEACVGGPFYPGIEGTYDIARLDTYHPRRHLRREFRIDPAHPAGFLTEKMALPWQADFADCADVWWPSQRPNDVTTKGGKPKKWARGVDDSSNPHLSMANLWPGLGFVVLDQATGKLVEDERTLPEPPHT